MALRDDFTPLGVVAAEAEPLGERHLRQILWALVLLGLAARAVRYLLAFPIWPDEAYLCANFINRGYLDLLEPLDHHQVAPVLFLWAELTSIRLFGFSEYSLRLVPFLCSVAGLFLFWHLAGRLLRGTALMLAVGIFAVGYPLLRYGCEAKPYGCDMFASLVLVTLAVEWWRSGRQRWLWGLSAMTPVALGLSYPAVFAAGGISLAVAFSLATSPGHRGWVPWAAYNLALVASFAGVYALSVGPQSASELDWMRGYWKDIFPPLASPLGMLGWLVEVHTSELLQYPIGGARGASTLTTICCAAALVFLWRRRQFTLVILCLAPLLPNLVAACLWRYPYGGSVRFVLYMAPMVCLLAGLGAAALLVRRDARGATKGRPAVLVLAALLAAVAVGSMGRDFLHPYRTDDVLHQRDFARWFWFTQQYDGEVACWDRDFPSAATSVMLGDSASALYLCNREIYLAGRGGPQWDRVSRDRPLRCVRYTVLNATGDDAAVARWIADLRTRYDLVSRQQYDLPNRHKDGELLYVDRIELYEFVPRATTVTATRSSPAS
jgi:hypothetical protein